MTGLAQRQPSEPVRWGLPAGRARFATLVAFYAGLVALCLATLVAAGDLGFGRNPWDNLLKTVGDFARPSFLDVWFGPSGSRTEATTGPSCGWRTAARSRQVSSPPWRGPRG